MWKVEEHRYAPSDKHFSYDIHRELINTVEVLKRSKSYGVNFIYKKSSVTEDIDKSETLSISESE